MNPRFHLDVLMTVALIILLSAGSGWSAIIERGSSSSGDTGSPLDSALSFAHNSGTGDTDCATFVGAAVRNTNSLTTGTYAGQTMTKIVEATTAGLRCEIWMLLATADGSNTVFLERVGSAMRFTGGAVTFCGVDQSTPYRTPLQTFAGTTTNVSHDVASGNGELVLAVIANEDSANGVTTGAGQTQEWNDQTTNATTSNNVVGVGSTEPGAAVVTIQYGQGISEDYVMCTISIRPSGVVSPGDVAEGLQPIIQ